MATLQNGFLLIVTLWRVYWVLGGSPSSVRRQEPRFVSQKLCHSDIVRSFPGHC
jgi:hypothetical protein